MSNQEEKNPSQSQESSSSESSSESLSSPQQNSYHEKIFGPDKSLDEDSYKSSTKSFSISIHKEKDKNFSLKDDDMDKYFNYVSPIYAQQKDESFESASSEKEIDEHIGDIEEVSKKMLGRKRDKSHDFDSNSSDEN